MPTEINYFGFLSGYIIFWGVFILAFGLFIHRIRQLLQYMFLGQEATGYNNWFKRVSSTLGYIF